ncbi:MAG: thioredoxin family protein [Alphaproteobacteria bacterium]|nr:thioredoxin family protein [Alphaproteobacteria bacterium]
MLAALLLAATLAWPDPWAGAEHLDVVEISRGEAVTLEEHLAAGKFTIVDFGAAWCSPCHDAAQDLKLYLSRVEDVAVRVVTLPEDPARTMDAPVVAQHLGARPRIPTLVVYDPDGERIYKGHSVERAVKLIERRR